MLPYLREHWYNPSSIYREAQQAHQAIDEARATIARAIGALPEEIIFVSGGSESDALALRGVLDASVAAGHGRHLITSAVEHHAVLDTAEQLEREGATEAYDCKWGARGINDDVLHQLDDARSHAADEDESLVASLVVFDARRSCDVRLARQTAPHESTRIVSLETLDELAR